MYEFTNFLICLTVGWTGHSVSVPNGCRYAAEKMIIFLLFHMNLRSSEGI